MSPLLSWSPEELQRFLVERIPFNAWCGITIADVAPGRIVADLPFDARLVGDAAANALHPGPITVMLDTICGTVALTRMPVPRRTATLDLRIDWLRAPGAGLGVRCIAEIIAIGEHVLTTRALAHDGDPADPVATAVGSFAVFPPSVAVPGGATS